MKNRRKIYLLIIMLLTGYKVYAQSNNVTDLGLTTQANQFNVYKLFEPIKNIRDNSVIYNANASGDYFERFKQINMREALGGAASFDSRLKFGFDSWFNVAIKNIIISDLRFGLLPIPSLLDKYTDGEAWYFDIGAGVNKRLFFIVPQYCYGILGIGACFITPSNEYILIKQDKNNKYGDAPLDLFLVKLNIGTEIPLYTPLFSLVLDASAFWVPGLQYVGVKASVGLSISYNNGWF